MVRTWARRAVERDVRRFVGWPEIIKLAAELGDPMYQAIYATAFLTGGRISEVLLLKKENFSIDKKFINVKDMPLLKRYKKIRTYVEEVDEPPKTNLGRLFQYDRARHKWWRRRFETKRVSQTRVDFGIPLIEPLTSILIDWVGNSNGGLFPDVSRWMTHTRFKGIGIYPHWLRAQRASCLISFWRFKMEEMMEWMGWEELTTARHYGRMGPKLYEKFAGVQIPQHIKKMEEKLIGD